MRDVKKHMLASSLDRYIPFNPFFVIPYLSLFPFIALTGILLFATPYANLYYLSMAVGMYTAAVSWFLFPAGPERPAVGGNSFLERVVLWVYHHDKRQNAFPSSHVFTALLSAHFLSLTHPTLAAVWWCLGGLIGVSTLFMKQHYVIDVVVGIFWVFGSIVVAEFLLTLLI